MVNIYQMRSTEKSAKTADETLQEMRTENRPWVGINTIELISMNPGEQIQVNAVFINSGKSPALKQSILAHLHVTNDADADLPEIGKPDEPITTVAIAVPMQPMNIGLRTVDKLDAAQIERVKKPEFRYYVYGVGSYDESTTQRTTHHIEFCMFARFGINGLTPCTGKRYKNTTD